MKLHFPDSTTYKTAATVLLANTYAAQSDFSRASDIRLKLNQSGVKKLTGLSWTVVNGQVVVSHSYNITFQVDLEIIISGFEHTIDLILIPKKYMLN